MSKSSKHQPMCPPEEKPVQMAPPAADDCGTTESPPMTEAPTGSDSLIDLNLSSLLTTAKAAVGDISVHVPEVSADISASTGSDDCGDGKAGDGKAGDGKADGGITVDVDAPIGVGLPGGAEGGVGLDIIGNLLGSGGHGGSLISLDGDSDAVVELPILGGASGKTDGSLISVDLDGSAHGGGSNAAIDVDLGGKLTGVDGTTDGGLIGLHEDSNALVNVPVFNGEGGGTVGGLLNAAMLDVGTFGTASFQSDHGAYDGNVALAGDLNAALGSTLDMLTMSPSLFDVPALDLPMCDVLDG